MGLPDDNEELNNYLDRAKREMFPVMEQSAFCMTIVGTPDPKLCLEIGAAIMYDKPILAIVPRGAHVPLSLRTIAHKVVEVSEDLNDDDKAKVAAAVKEIMEIKDFRPVRHGKMDC